EKTDEQGWADPGAGVLDLKAIVTAGVAAGAENFFVGDGAPRGYERLARKAIAAAREFLTPARPAHPNEGGGLFFAGRGAEFDDGGQARQASANLGLARFQAFDFFFGQFRPRLGGIGAIFVRADLRLDARRLLIGGFLMRCYLAEPRLHLVDDLFVVLDPADER